MSDEFDEDEWSWSDGTEFDFGNDIDNQTGCIKEGTSNDDEPDCNDSLDIM